MHGLMKVGFIMIIKDIAKQGIPEIGNILPLKKNNIVPIKISKTIEIVVVPNFRRGKFTSR